MKAIDTTGYVKVTSAAVVAAVVGAAMLVGGCASSGLSPREQPGRDVSAYLRASQMVGDGGAGLTSYVQRNDEAGPARIIKPASVAVAQIGEVTPPDEMLRELEARPDLFHTVQAVSGMSDGARRHGDQAAAVKNHLESMRAFAADIGADYLLVYGGTVDASERGGPLGLLDLTIVGAFVVPSHKLEVEAKATAMLLDTRTGRPIATASSDAEASTISPSVGLRGRQIDQMQEARDETIDELTDRIISRFEQLEVTGE